MWSLFRIVFSKGYWLLLTRGAFWRDTWVALGRMHKDRRARKQVRLAGTVLFVPLVVLTGTLVVLGTTAWIFLVPAFAVGWLVRRVGAEKPPNLRTPWADAEVAPPERLRDQLVDLTIVYAVLLQRAGSEGFLAVKSLPEEIEVTTRRRHVDVLRQRGLWDRLEPAARNLLMLPDGHWPEASVREVAGHLEELRMLRWILRHDRFLPAVGQDVELSYALANEIAAQPKLLLGKSLVSTADLRTARQSADDCFHRCYAEGLHRGYFAQSSEETAEWAYEFARSMMGEENRDWLLGRETVAKADEEAIRRATSRAYDRALFCDWMLRLFGGENGAERLGLKQRDYHLHPHH